MAFTVTTSTGGVLSPKNLPLRAEMLLLEDEELDDEDEAPARCLLACFGPLPGLKRRL